jgi:hypothetical protein
VAYSEQFANPAWAGSVTVTDNAAIAPNGSQTAAKLVEGGSFGWYGVYQGFAYVPGTVLYVSLSVKAAERTKLRLNCASGNARFYGDFDLVAGTVVATGAESGEAGTGALLGAQIVSQGNGWYRLQIAGSVSGTLTMLYFVTELQTVSGQTTNYYQGDATSGLYIWGASVTRESWVYVPTRAVAVASVNRDAVLAPVALLQPGRALCQSLFAIDPYGGREDAPERQFRR